MFPDPIKRQSLCLSLWKKSWRESQTFVRALQALILEWVTRTGFVEWWDAAENFKTASGLKSVVGPCWWACKRRGCLTMLRIFVPLLHARAGALHVFVYSWLGLNPLHIEDCEDRRKGRKIDSMLGLWELSCNARMLMQQTGSHVRSVPFLQVLYGRIRVSNYQLQLWDISMTTAGSIPLMTIRTLRSEPCMISKWDTLLTTGSNALVAIRTFMAISNQNPPQWIQIL